MAGMNELGDAMSIEDVEPLLSTEVTSAVDFIAETFEDDWATAEYYYKGNTDFEHVEGRSNVVKTELRDAVRNTMPSVMRVLCQSRKLVEYYPSDVRHGDWTHQQSEYLTDFFWRNGGYLFAYHMAKNAMKLKYSPIRVYFEENPSSERITYTNAPATLLTSLMGQPDVEDLEYTATDDPALLNISYYKTYPHGALRFEVVPNAEFFISRHCTSVKDAEKNGVHGMRREITVAEALDLGLEYGAWDKLDGLDVEEDRHGKSTTTRRGYSKRDDIQKTADITKHRFLLTMAYFSTDLKGLGTPQLYKFWLGGTSYKVLDYDEVDFSEFELAQIDPEPGTIGGTSIADLTVNEQDTGTSLIRAILDNAHAANNPRMVANPERTNFDDIMNQAIGAPIRSRSGEPIQTVSIPFTGGQLLPVMGYLDMDVQNKVGVTKAAQGLDPDALQSTDKDAVLNTIATSQGQTELIVRNLIETALIPFFAKVLKLSLRHQSPIQIMRTRGMFIPIDLRMFDPDAAAVPSVGLGTGEAMQKQQTLAFVLQKQEAYMQQFGYDNPFTSLDKIFNTLEDLTELGGLANIGRYFNIVTPDTEKVLAKRQEDAAKAQKEENADAQPIDPNRAYLAVEQGKQQMDQLRIIAEQRAKEAELAQRTFEAAERADLERDRLVQNKHLKLMELGKEAKAAQIAKEQGANNERSKRTAPRSTGSSGEKTG